VVVLNKRRSVGPGPTEYESFSKADRALAGELFVSDEAYQNLIVLCDECGSRFGGTQGERDARDFMMEKMRAYGLEDVHSEAFDYLGWIRGPATLRTLAPVEKEFPCISLPYAEAATVEANLVDLGDGTPNDFVRHGEVVGGNVVLVNGARVSQFFRRPLHYAEKYGHAVAANASAFIWMSDVPGLQQTGCLRFNRAAEIPGVGVSREVGEALLRLGRRGPVRVRLETTDLTAPMTSWNVIGEVGGRLWPQRFLILGAHFDGHDIAQGAMDNAAGAAVLLEVARGLALCGDLLHSTVRFVLFAAEDIGMIGSHAYMDAHRGEVDKFTFMFNLDGPGVDEEKVILLQGCPELQSPIEGALQDMKQPIPVGDRLVHPFTDHYPFMLAGVPTALVWVPNNNSGRWRFGHTAADTVDKVSPRAMQTDAILIARLMLRLSRLDPWPGTHRTWQQVKANLAGEDLLEMLKVEARYPFPE
jgi:Zn-dependent M28 family amino/carboxypeptidase